MIKVFIASWSLFLGMFMLMVGNGLQGTLLGVRGGIENFFQVDMRFFSAKQEASRGVCEDA